MEPVLFVVEVSTKIDMMYCGTLGGKQAAYKDTANCMPELFNYILRT